MKNTILDQYNGKTEKIWEDKKHYFGLPVSFTWYSMGKDRLFIKSGLIVDRRQETLLYRVKDISVKRGLIQKLFGVGTIVIETLDASSRYLFITSVKNPEAVKEMIHDYVEQAKKNASIEQILG